MSRRGWLLFAAMSLIWGIPYLLIKVADEGVAPPVLVLARVAVGAALLLPIAIARRELTPLLPHWRWLALFALVEIIIPWLLLSAAETRLPSSLSGLLVACAPILVAVLGRLTGGQDRLSPARWAGLLVGLGGVALLVAGSSTRGSGLAIAGVLGVALCYSIGPLVAARKLGDLPPLGMTAACLTLAAIVYAPAAALTWPAAVPPARVLASLAGLGVACTALAFVLFFALIAAVGPARSSVITYVNPAVAVVLGIAVLGERFTATMAVSFALILCGSVLATRTARPAPAPAARNQQAALFRLPLVLSSDWLAGMSRVRPHGSGRGWRSAQRWSSDENLAQEPQEPRGLPEPVIGRRGLMRPDGGGSGGVRQQQRRQPGDIRRQQRRLGH